MNTPDKPVTRTFKKRKETQNKVVYAEAPPSGQPPIVETLYVAKWFVGDSQQVTMTLDRS